MAQTAKINTNKKNASSTAIRVLDNKVEIENIKLENPGLAELLKKEKSNNKKHQLLEIIIEQGVNVYNSLKTRVETDLAKTEFNNIKQQMDISLEGAKKDMQKEYVHYFDEKKGVIPKLISSLGVLFDKDSEQFLKDLQSQNESLINGLEITFNDFLDDDSKKSALGKINSVIETFDTRMEKLLKKAQDLQISTLENALDPEVKESKTNVLREQIKEITKSEFKNVNENLEKIILQLDTKKAQKELIEKSTQKGTTFEDLVQQSLSKIGSGVGDFVEPTSKVKGKSGFKGDHTVLVDSNSSVQKKNYICFESKTEEYNTIQKISKYLDEAMDNRNAEIGIMVFDKYERFKKITDLPFMPISQNQAIVVLDLETGDETPLKLAYMWARTSALKIATEFRGSEEFDLQEIENLVRESISSISLIKEVKTGHTQAKNGIKHSEKFLDQLETDLRSSLNEINKQFELTSK